ncbi:MAG: nicotinamide-nucleotide amidohydrolase family protein [Flavisolibacter sp.]|nr:nicotinamide-nucleotide amidohydrolase family protein [Flavisolibacter sp.]
MNEVNAAIITIGDELLIGQTIDTNSAFIAQELNQIGIWVKRRIAIGDVKEEILKALEEQSRDCNVIIITGGLGPTADDITKPALCEYFGSKLVMHQPTLEHVTYLFEHVFRRPMPLLERNRKQAEVPDVCTVLKNERGTAPGMWFGPSPTTTPKVQDGAKAPSRWEGDKDSDSAETSDKKSFSSLSSPTGGQGGVVISLPGVPHEMKGLMLDSVIPKLKETFELPVVLHKTLLTSGIGESSLAEHIAGFENKLPSHIKLAYLPAYGMVRLRLTSKGSDQTLIKNELDDLFAQLKSLVKKWMVADEDISLPDAVIRLLKSKKKTVSTAESCTGGNIAHLITSIAGSSAVYNGSVVSYANEAKKDLLLVKEETLQQFGAVSEPTVTEMVSGALKELKTDYAIATSGIMGPDGGTPEKPVGTVWIAVGNNKRIMALQHSFRFDRERNIELTTHNALSMLYRFVKEEEGE